MMSSRKGTVKVRKQSSRRGDAQTDGSLHSIAHGSSEPPLGMHTANFRKFNEENGMI